MGRIKFELEPGEEKVGKWTIHYLPPTGGKFARKLLVTDRRILFEALNSKQDRTTGTARGSGSRAPTCGLSRRGPAASPNRSA